MERWEERVVEVIKDEIKKRGEEGGVHGDEKNQALFKGGQER